MCTLRQRSNLRDSYPQDQDRREKSRQLVGYERVDPQLVKHTFIVQYDDVQSHTYTLCHRCWAVARRRILILLASPALLFITYAVGSLFVDQPSGTTFLIMLATFVLMLAIVVPIAKTREPWHRLKRLAVQERGGPPFVVFEGSEDDSNIILPL